ncbi:MAG: large subunit ribosomal protein [Thermoleophilaceae bacterium]|nr:large subunit ribosomal protein [Thermoleophilaceae bacterium]
MNRDQKAAVIDGLADQLQSSEAVFAIDYRGLSVSQAVELRTALTEADATFQVAKNTLTERAADRAGAERIKPLLEGPTALTFVRGDVALAAKALATFRRQNNVLEFKGGQMGGELLSTEQIESIARLPARDVLIAQFAGIVASPITGVVRGLAALISGMASQLGQIRDQGLVTGGPGEAAPEAEAPAEAEVEAPAAAEAPAEESAAPAETDETPSEAPGDPVAEAEAAEQEQTSETPSEGDDKTETEEG